MSAHSLTERGIHIEFPNATRVTKFDGYCHGMSHCFKAVDGICEWLEETWLVEIKDPEDSRIPERMRKERLRAFEQNLLAPRHRVSGESSAAPDFFKEHLAQKLKDTVLYLHLDRRLPDKAMKFLVLAGADQLDPALLLSAQDRLRGACGDPKTGTPWRLDYAVAFLTLEQWNKRFPHCPARRVQTRAMGAE